MTPFIWPAVVLLTLRGGYCLYDLCFGRNEPIGRVADLGVVAVYAWALWGLLR